MEITSDTWEASDLNEEYKVCIKWVAKTF
jgi:hypothetical protein